MIIIILFVVELASANQPFAHVTACYVDSMQLTINSDDAGVVNREGHADCSLIYNSTDTNLTIKYNDCGIQPLFLNTGNNAGYFMSVRLRFQPYDVDKIDTIFGVSCYYSSFNVNDTGANFNVSSPRDGGSSQGNAGTQNAVDFLINDVKNAGRTTQGSILKFTVKLSQNGQESYKAILPTKCWFADNPNLHDNILYFVDDGCPTSVPNVVDEMTKESDMKYTVKFTAFKIGTSSKLYVNCLVKLCLNEADCESNCYSTINTTADLTTTAASGSRRRKREATDDGVAQEQGGNSILVVELDDSLKAAYSDHKQKKQLNSAIVVMMLMSVVTMMAVMIAAYFYLKWKKQHRYTGTMIGKQY